MKFLKYLLTNLVKTTYKNNNVHEVKLKSEDKHDETLKYCKQTTVQIAFTVG